MGQLTKTTAEIEGLLNKVEKMPSEGVVGKTPVLETGVTTTLPAGSSATSEVLPNGVDASGNPKYKVNLGIPKGADGASGGGGSGVSDIVYVDLIELVTVYDAIDQLKIKAVAEYLLPHSQANKTIRGYHKDRDLSYNCDVSYCATFQTDGSYNINYVVNTAYWKGFLPGPFFVSIGYTQSTNTYTIDTHYASIVKNITQ